MATAIFMPKNGMAMEEGVLVRWLVKEGDKVEMDQPIMEIETDKITMEDVAPASGTILALYAKDGDTIPVLETMGWIGEPGEKVEAPNVAPAAGPTTPETAAESAGAPSEVLMSFPPEEAPKAAPNADGVILATPYAKKLAADKGIDLANVTPTGKHGEIVGADVENAPTGPKATPVAKNIAAANGIDLNTVEGSGFNGKITKADVLGGMHQAEPAPVVVDEEGVEARVKMSGMRKTIAQRMTQSYFENPVVTQNVSADVTALLALRAKINEGKEKADRISINDFVMKACAIAVSEHPLVRTIIDGDELVTMKATNVGMAVGSEGGLIVPVIKNADMLSLSKLSAQAKDLANRARNGGLKMDEYTGSTFTVSNMGMYEVDSFSPIINQPNCAIMGVCRVRDELALVDGEVVVKKMMGLSLTFDHRILDGVTAAQFELRIKKLLENPMEILL